MAGVAIGFLVPVIPFAVTAPRRFYNSFFAAQLFRVVPTRTPVEKRLRLMTGIGQVLHLDSTGVLILSLAITALIVGALPLAWLVTRAPADRPGLVRGRQLRADRGRLPLVRPVLPALPGVPGAVPRAGHRTGRGPADPAGLLLCQRSPGPRSTGRGWIEWTVAGLITLGVLALAIPQASQERSVTPRVSAAALAAVRRIVPPGACVLTDQVSYTIAADRFYSTTPGCSLLVDSIGTDYALGHGRDASSGAADYPAVEASWRTAFDHAQYVWLSGSSTRGGSPGRPRSGPTSTSTSTGCAGRQARRAVRPPLVAERRARLPGPPSGRTRPRPRAGGRAALRGRRRRGSGAGVRVQSAVLGAPGRPRPGPRRGCPRGRGRAAAVRARPVPGQRRLARPGDPGTLGRVAAVTRGCSGRGSAPAAWSCTRVGGRR